MELGLVFLFIVLVISGLPGLPISLPLIIVLIRRWDLQPEDISDWLPLTIALYLICGILVWILLFLLG